MPPTRRTYIGVEKIREGDINSDLYSYKNLVYPSLNTECISKITCTTKTGSSITYLCSFSCLVKYLVRNRGNCPLPGCVSLSNLQSNLPTTPKTSPQSPNGNEILINIDLLPPTTQFCDFSFSISFPIPPSQLHPFIESSYMQKVLQFLSA